MIGSFNHRIDQYEFILFLFLQTRLVADGWQIKAASITRRVMKLLQCSKFEVLSEMDSSGEVNGYPPEVCGKMIYGCDYAQNRLAIL